jgi:putative tryptophan/tyrosine transport system substrate-binding protein
VKRRDFIALIGGAAAWPLAAGAQQTPITPTIGFLGAGPSSTRREMVAAFVRRLAELGWIEGQTVAIEYRWATGGNDQLAEIVDEFVRRRVNVMALEGTAATLAAKRATSTIPIVFPLSGDPVGTGLVASLTRPGGNATGLSIQQPDAAGKRLELLREALPDLTRLGIMANVGSPNSEREVREVREAATALGLQAFTFPIRRAEDIVDAFEAMKGRMDGLYVVGDPLVDTHRVRISTLALGTRLPTMFVFRNYVEAGGLMSYGPNFADLFRRAAEFVDKILRGTKPDDIPVEQPTKFDLVINLTTAKALGLTIPDKLLALANDVIE